MTFWIQLLILAVSGPAVLSQTCPSKHFSAVFIATVDKIIDDPILRVVDSNLTFLKTVMKFRENEIQHAIDDAIRFFNDEYGLDFSNSTPNPQNQRVFQNATMEPYFLPPDIVNFIITDNHWIRSGSTRSNCYSMLVGGFYVTFSGEQILYGNYGGAEGRPTEIIDRVFYGFYHIDSCKQSPIIVQFQTVAPIARAIVGGTVFGVSDVKLYNRVLGYGQSVGVGWIAPVSDGQFRLTMRSIITFPAVPV